MPSLHHCTAWGSMRCELEFFSFDDKSQDKVYLAYHPQHAPQLAVFRCLTSMISETLKNVHARALEMVGRMTGSVICINPFTTIELIHQCLQLSTPEDEKNAEPLLKKFGLNKQEFAQCVQKSKKIADSYFIAKGKPIFVDGMKPEAIQQWQIKTAVDMQNFAYAAMGLVQSNEKVHFGNAELDFFQVKSVKVDPVRLNCLAFALLKIKELSARELIFTNYPDSILDNLFSQLASWSYRNVKYPDIGDLVVYVGNDGKPSHVGYINEEGLVHSKLGILNPYSHTHHIFDIPEEYGATLLFFRKVRFQISEP